MVWSEEVILLLRELWAQGHSTAEIGRRLGVTKNAIVGKAHRLDLTARPSPIRRDAISRSAERAPAPPRVEGPTLPPLASSIVQPLAPPMAQPMAASIQPIRIAAVAPPPLPPVARAPRPPIPSAPVAPPVRAVMPAAPVQYRRPAPSCCWPIGEPGKADFRFCDDASVPGKPYCDEHAKLAYVRIRDRKEDAA